MFIYSLKSPDEYKDKTKVLNHSIFISEKEIYLVCLLYTSPSPRDRTRSRMPSSA